MTSRELQQELERSLQEKLPLAGSTWWPMTWKAKVTPLGRQYYQLAVSVRRTKGTDCGLWPTPNRGMQQGGCNARPAQVQKLLENNKVRSSGAAMQVMLEDLVVAVAMWPTPYASDNRDRGNLSNPCVQRRIELGKQIGLTTLAKSVGLTAQTEKRGQLNPAFTCWLMGYPLNYEKLLYTALETQSCQR